MKSHGTIIVLLSIPISMLGFVQLFFSALSLTVFHDDLAWDFFVPAIIMMCLAGLLYIASWNIDVDKFTIRDTFLFSTCTWVSIGFLAALPIKLITHVSFTDAIFESVSAVTTTGATILVGLDEMPKTFLMYRQFLQWLGGLGIVVFVVAILSMPKSGAMHLLKAETPGPIKDDKLAPKIKKTAHYLWLVYLLMTTLCALAYFFSGMNGFDAVAHSLTTVSTGGFSTHDASLGYYHSESILAIADFFMLLGAINFGLHFRVLYRKKAALYFKDEETVIFLAIVSVMSLIIAWYLCNLPGYHSNNSPISSAVFHLISFITSTGYIAEDVSKWPYALLILLIVVSYMGGCAGSTAGGNKIIRTVISFKLINREFKRLLHRDGVFNMKYNKHPIEEQILTATMTFMSVTAFCSMTLTFILMSTGLDFFSSLSAIAACVNVLGPAFGELGSNFQPVSDTGTWVLSMAMILGRLEYFTILVLFSPSYWRY